MPSSLVDELPRALPEHRMLVLTRAGIRAPPRPGLPPGALVPMAASEAGQHGHILAALLSNGGVAHLERPTLANPLAVRAAASRTVVGRAHPPCYRHEFPASGASPTRSVPAKLTPVEDVDGVYTVDPHAPGASRPKLVPLATTADLAAAPSTLPFDRTLLDMLTTARNLRQVQIVNDLVSGNLLHALRGEHVGTIVRAT